MRRLFGKKLAFFKSITLDEKEKVILNFKTMCPDYSL
jgi:hypothetical protein